MSGENRGSAKRGSHYVTAALARRAVALSAPMIENAMEDSTIVGSGFLYVIVLDPGVSPTTAEFDDAILYEHAFGDRSKWDADYASFARDKARLSWTTGRDGRILQNDFPHLLRTGDSTLTGGICLDGIVVAASGAFAAYDEVFATTIAAWLRAFAREARSAETGLVLRSE